MATREQNKLDKAVLRKYERFERIGIGAYGACWKAVCKKTAKIVAVKKLFDPFANREDGRRTCIEVMLVQTVLNHPNIIKLLNVLKAENEADLYLVYEYMDTDLRSVIRAVPQILQEIHKQYIAYQLFAALNFMHSSGVLYCGLKPHNILINTDCEIKLTDFGNARLIDSTSNEMGFIAARWYHSPEQLLGGTKFSTGVDMWAAGCVIAELLSGQPLFHESGSRHVQAILQVTGKPSRQDIQSMGLREEMVIRPERPQIKLEELLPNASRDAIDLLGSLLKFNPKDRLSAAECLTHPYVVMFHEPASEQPEPSRIAGKLPMMNINHDVIFPALEYKEMVNQHMIETRKQRRANMKATTEETSEITPT
eukprot:c19976_g1_i3.p1 GENE.c19976_g1_i3~~c19976_g1_i3.p1  ORF type:complete len:367 (+),score=65.90 c19976_g1_i3:37-1137(+)